MQSLFEHYPTSKAASPEGSCVASFLDSIPSSAQGHGSVRVFQRLITSPVKKSLGRSVVDDIYRTVDHGR